MKLQNFPLIKIWKIKHSRRQWTSINFEASDLLQCTQIPSFLLLNAWSALKMLYPTVSRYLLSIAVVESRYVSDIKTTSRLWLSNYKLSKVT